MAKKPQLPLKDVMAAIDKKNKSFYTNLSDEQKKAFSAWMMMRYCSSVQGKHAANYIYMTNELVNLQIAIYSFGLLILLYHSNKKDSISFSFKFPEIRPYFKKILNFSSYSFLGSFSNIIVLNVVFCPLLKFNL